VRKHRWSGPKLDRSGHVQRCAECGAVKGFFAPQAAAVHGVETAGSSTTLYRCGEKWVSKRPACRPEVRGTAEYSERDLEPSRD